jgi:hypothetical protein
LRGIKHEKTAFLRCCRCTSGDTFELSLSRVGEVFTANFVLNGIQRVYSGGQEVPGALNLRNQDPSIPITDEFAFLAFGFDVNPYRILNTAIDCRLIEISN